MIDINVHIVEMLFIIGIKVIYTHLTVGVVGVEVIMAESEDKE